MKITLHKQLGIGVNESLFIKTIQTEALKRVAYAVVVNLMSLNKEDVKNFTKKVYLLWKK